MTDDEFDALADDRFPPITVIQLTTGQIMTLSRASAKREIAFGAAVETVPADPEQAKAWLAETRERAVSSWQQRERERKAKYFDHERPEPVLADYEAWCAEQGSYAFPADEAKVVRWLLDRAASGKLEITHVSRWASVIADVHHYTNHPPRHLARSAISSFNRAIDFAKMALRASTHNIHEVPALAPAKAREMFADGLVPRRYDEIAA